MRPDRAAVGEPKMTPAATRSALTEAAVADLMNAITATTARRIAGEPDAPYIALERRWREIGGMLELARRLDAWRAPWKPTRTPCVDGSKSSPAASPLSRPGPASAGPPFPPYKACAAGSAMQDRVTAALVTHSGQQPAAKGKALAAAVRPPQTLAPCPLLPHPRVPIDTPRRRSRLVGRGRRGEKTHIGVLRPAADPHRANPARKP